MARGRILGRVCNLGEMRMKRHLLKQVMIDNHDNMDDLAKELGVNANTLYVKMAGVRSQFSQAEIQKVAERYSLTPEQTFEIFFRDRVK